MLYGAISGPKTAASAATAITAAERIPATPIAIAAPLPHLHAAGAQVSGSGITLTAPLTKAHATGAQVTDNFPTPSAPNQYHRKHQ